LRTPNSDKPASVGTMCFTGLSRKPCFLSPPMISARVAGVPMPLAHRGQLQQIVSNIITNAADAMRAIGDRTRLLRVKSTTAETERILISFEDSGIGIDTKKPRAHFRSLLHHETPRHGDGFGYLQVNRRGAWWKFNRVAGHFPWFCFSNCSANCQTKIAGGSFQYDVECSARRSVEGVRCPRTTKQFRMDCLSHTPSCRSRSS